MRTPSCARSSSAICTMPNCGSPASPCGAWSWDKTPFDQRELAFRVKEAAKDCLATLLSWSSSRDCWVKSRLSGACVYFYARCLLIEVLDGRYALTLRLMLAIVRRKLGLGLGNTGHTQPVPTDGSTILVGGTAGPNPSDPAAQGATLEDFGFVWPAEGGAWSPSLATRGGETHFIFIYLHFLPFLFSWCSRMALLGRAICRPYPRRGEMPLPLLPIQRATRDTEHGGREGDGE